MTAAAVPRKKCEEFCTANAAAKIDGRRGVGFQVQDLRGQRGLRVAAQPGKLRSADTGS